MNTYINLLNNLETLNLSHMRENINNTLDDESNKSKTVIELLEVLTSNEIKFKKKRASEINLKISKMPFVRSVGDFDFSYQPNISKDEILDLNTLRFIDKQENILFIGSSGVGKTHLAVAIASTCAKTMGSTYFIHFNDLMNKIKKYYDENRTEQLVKHYAKYKLLVIDEIGYMPIEKEYANIFFQLIAKRYERKSTIITTNQPLSKWGEVFGDTTIATAIIDRLVHHSTIVKITGRSYRIKGKIDEKTLK